MSFLKYQQRGEYGRGDATSPRSVSPTSDKRINPQDMINYDLNKIRAIIFDVDGVLSASTIFMDAEGLPQRTMNIKDGYAIQLARKHGIEIAIITGGKGDAIRKRYEGLGVTDIFMSCKVKIDTYEKYLTEKGLADDEIIYVGDDIPDYEIMQRVGCPCCPKDACPDIREISLYVSPYDGGHGCARDILEQVMRAKKIWLHSEKAFGW